MKSKYQSVNEQKSKQEEMQLEDYLYSLYRRGMLEDQEVINCPLCDEETLMLSVGLYKSTATCAACGIKTTIDF